MRLFELLENVPVDVTTKPMRRPMRPGTSRIDYRGEGSFGVVYQDQDNPHEVMKFSTGINAYRDGYLDYIQEIAHDKSIQDNPWVPRILKLRVHKNKHDEVDDFSVRLEALQSVNTLEIDEVFAILDRVFTSEYVEQTKMYHKRWDPRHQLYATRDALILAIWTCIKSLDSERIVKDEHFLEFIKWHERVFAEHDTDHSFDPGMSNLMVRRSPYGSQIVITDPWA